MSGDWVFLTECRSQIPSGSSTATEADKQYANETGESFDIEPSDRNSNPYVPVRYVRFRFLDMWVEGLVKAKIIIAEIDFYGVKAE